jgi:hypothetical protein
MNYVEIGTTTDGQKLFGRVDDDGLMRVTCIESDPQYQAWLNPTDTLVSNSSTPQAGN